MENIKKLKLAKAMLIAGIAFMTIGLMWIANNLGSVAFAVVFLVAGTGMAFLVLTRMKPDKMLEH